MNSMNRRLHGKPMARHAGEAGITLIETVIALAILFVATAGLMGLGVLGTITTENQGHLATRTTEYAQDKMEQLLSLAFGDNQTDTISTDCVLYLVNADCSDPSRGEVGIAVGGSTTARTDHYVDYLSAKGEPLGGGTAGPPGWFYERRWEVCFLQADGVTCNATATHLKRITVWTTVRSVIGQNTVGLQPVAILSSYKTDPF